MKKLFLGVITALSIASILVIGGATNVTADSHSSDAMKSTTFMDILNAVVVTDSSELENIRLSVGQMIPTDGANGAFGFGVITGAGLEAIIVTTTHAGVYDSIAQTDANDASFHNHYVALHDLKDDPTCPGLQVRDISFQEPGDVHVSDYGIVFEDTPYYFGATHSLSGKHISFNADDMPRAAVSFTINPVDPNGKTSVTDIAAVCINDVKSVDINDVVPSSYWEGN
ncbi:MAG: hypothetical protein F4Y18_03480 [Cenarchaeum sp. SB0663_bin_5]|nr:hypothetical protein [Cenarchaeum sp. SB0663_bin_5]MYL11348.1 hypothetical protein [Cenarchaeum sp. SB0669_bin_11]